jgi:hypothetical protein
MLKRSARSLLQRIEADVNMPWTAFDLAQTYLFLEDEENFLKYAEDGILATNTQMAARQQNSVRSKWYFWLMRSHFSKFSTRASMAVFCLIPIFSRIMLKL